MSIKEKINYYRQHWFVRNVAVLQAGSFAGTIFQALAGVFLARMLQPELFGIYSLVFGLASLGGLFLGAGIQEAASTMLGSAYARQDRDEVRDVLAFLLKITFYAGIVTSVLMFLMPKITDYFYENPIIGTYTNIVIVGVFLSAFFTAAFGLSLQVTGRIRALTLVVFGDQFFRFGIALLLVFMGFGVWGAVSGQFFGAALLFIVAIFSWKKLQNHYPILPSLGELFRRTGNVSISKYIKFSIWVAIDRNMGNLYMALPVTLIGIYVSVGEVSFFKLAFGFVNIALSLLGPISTLLNTEFSKMNVQNQFHLFRNFIKVSYYGVIFSFLLTLAAVIVSPFAFKILYGESFMPGVKYVFGLFYYGALFGIGIGLGPMWRAINRVKVSIVINLCILGVGIPAGLVLIQKWGIWGSVVMVTLWFTVSHLISFAYLYKNLKELPKI